MKLQHKTSNLLILNHLVPTIPLRLSSTGWRAFYDANNGAIPIECQAGRAAMGMAAEETRLVRIEEGED